MDWSDTTSPVELEKALKERRWDDARAWIAALQQRLTQKSGPVKVDMAHKVLSTLRAATWFGEMRSLAAKFQDTGSKDPEIRRQLAQAMIEQGNVTDGITELKALEGELSHLVRSDPFLLNELSEVTALLGRAYKQLYVNACPTSVEPRRYDLQRAEEYYRKAFVEKLGDYRWSGVNYIALLHHNEHTRSQQGASALAAQEASMHARSILKELENKEAKGEALHFWDYSNRVECLLAEGKATEAISATRHFLDANGLDAFAVRSTLRQLRELWMLDGKTEPGREMLPMIEARLLELGNGTKIGDSPPELATSPEEVTRLEKVWDDTRYQSIEWLLTAIQRAASVARLGKSQFEGSGTGFVFDGRWLGDKWVGRNLLVTNAHVCTPDRQLQLCPPFPLPPEETKAVFLGAADLTELGELEVRAIWTSPPNDLDATLLEVLSDIELPRLPMSQQMPGTDGPDSRVNILGHPLGGAMKVSLQDNEVIGMDERILHYRTPTDPGSSGSPVFNQRWDLVALHHAAVDNKSVNEGVRMDVLLQRVREDLARQGDKTASKPKIVIPSVPEAVVGGETMVVQESELRRMLCGQETGILALKTYFDRIETGPFSYEYRLKENVLVEDDVPDDLEGFGLDVIGLANSLNRAMRYRAFKKSKSERPDAPVLVSEGDSWFQHPYLKETISQLTEFYNIRSLGAAGDVLSNMLSQQEYLGAIHLEHPVAFLFSGLGNDIMTNFSERLNPYFPNDGTGPRRLLNMNMGVAGSFASQLTKGLLGYQALAEQIGQRFAGLPIIVHGYDYAAPGEGKRDNWLKPRMDERDIPLEEQQAVVNAMIDDMNESLRKLGESYANIHYVNCRGAASHQPVPWDDAIHPHEEGFREVAGRFHQKIQEVMGQSG